MLAIQAIVLAVSAGFFLVAVATVLVILGVRREERLETLTRQHPPTMSAALARRLLGTYVRLGSEEDGARDDQRYRSR